MQKYKISEKSESVTRKKLVTNERTYAWLYPNEFLGPSGDEYEVGLVTSKKVNFILLKKPMGT